MGQGFDTKFEAFLFAGSNLDGAVLYALILSVFITDWRFNLPPVFFMLICTAGIRIRHAQLFQPIRIIFGISTQYLRSILSLSISRSTTIPPTASNTHTNDMCAIATPTKRLDILEDGLKDLDIYIFCNLNI
jgi:hypothetical protein